MGPPQQRINFVDYNSLLVINQSGKMRQLFVPFKVQTIQDISSFKRGSWVIVEEVQSHARHKLLYRIGSTWWSYHLFRISTVF